ncbi:MAG: NADH-quinone oxidoreductase subunit L [Chitinophagaceae bacterium]
MSKAFEFVWLVPLLPFIGFIINGLFRKSLSKTMTGIIGCGTILGSFFISVLLFLQVKEGHAEIIKLFDFVKVGSLSIPFAFQVDQLSVLFLLIITGIGLLIHVYSTAYMHEENSDHFARYFSFLNLFVFSMLLLVLGANYVIMFIGWEGVGLCSYLLIGYWFKNNDYTNAAKKAFIMNRIGDLGFLLAVFWMINQFGSVSFGDIFSKASGTNISVITGITLLLFVGATGKSAQIPLYTWLPDAMAGPTPVSALIHAATMVTAGIYMIARSNVLYSLSHFSQDIVAYIGAATAILAATIALKQNDIKKVLAYSTVSQLGYMFMALGVGAYSAAVFHVMTHAFFKALLFLGSGSVIHAMGGEQDITKMGGLSKKLKITYFTFLIGTLAIAGFPFFSGFFSKDAILLAAFEHNKIIYGIALIGAMLTGFYMFRLLLLTFHGSFRGTEEQKNHLHESPAAMTIPLILLAILSLAGGFIELPAVLREGGNKLSQFLGPVIPIISGHEVPHSTEWLLMALATGLVTVAVLIAFYKYRKYTPTSSTALGKVLENKWYVDEFYDFIIVKPLRWLGKKGLSFMENEVIDWIVNGVGKIVQLGSRQLRLVQSGQVGSYVLLMVISILVFFAVQFFFKK